MSRRVGRYVMAGAGTVGLYVGGVWLSTSVLGLPVQPTNTILYILSRLVAFALNYKWVFASKAAPGRPLVLFGLLQIFGIGLNALWVAAGVHFTPFYPWIIAATYFGVWAILAYNIQKRFIFHR